MRERIWKYALTDLINKIKRAAPCTTLSRGVRLYTCYVKFLRNGAVGKRVRHDVVGSNTRKESGLPGHILAGSPKCSVWNAGTVIRNYKVEKKMQFTLYLRRDMRLTNCTSAQKELATWFWSEAAAVVCWAASAKQQPPIWRQRRWCFSLFEKKEYIPVRNN